MSNYVHPKLWENLADRYTSVCTVQSQAAGVDAYGYPNGAWVNKIDHIDIPCSVHTPPWHSLQEQRIRGLTVIRGAHRVALAGPYPEITKEMRVVINNVIYNVLDVQTDAYGESTYLNIEEQKS